MILSTMGNICKNWGGNMTEYSLLIFSLTLVFNANQVEAESGVLYSNSRLGSRIPELNMIYFCLDSVEKIRV